MPNRQPYAKQNATEKYENPPQPEQQQAPPGIESEMQPKANYGEQSYRGSGKLTLLYRLRVGTQLFSHKPTS